MLGLRHGSVLGCDPRRQAPRGQALALTRLSFSSGLLFAGKSLQQEQKKIRGKKPKVRHISPFSCCCCSLQSLPHPQQFGWKKPKMLCLDFCGGKPWPRSWNTSVQGNWQSWGFSLPWNSTLDLGKP